jgi:hypothetical protein
MRRASMLERFMRRGGGAFVRFAHIAKGRIAKRRKAGGAARFFAPRPILRAKRAHHRPPQPR